MDVAWKSYTSVFKDAHCPRIWAAVTYAYTLMPLVAGHGWTEHLQSKRKQKSKEEKPDTLYEMANSDLLVVYKNIC